MLVRPGGVSAGGMHHAKNCIRPNEVPRINRGAAFARVTFQLLSIDRLNSAIPGGRAAIQLGLVEVDSFIEFGGSSRRRCVWHAVSGAACHAVAGGGRRRLK